MKRNNAQRTPQELYDFWEKIVKYIDMFSSISMLIVAVVLLCIEDAPDWLTIVCGVLAVIMLVALVVSIAIGIKLRLLKKKLGGTEVKKEREAEHEKE